jgi:hypothetical protein
MARAEAAAHKNQGFFCAAGGSLAGRAKIALIAAESAAVR